MLLYEGCLKSSERNYTFFFTATFELDYPKFYRGAKSNLIIVERLYITWRPKWLKFERAQAYHAVKTI